MSLFDSNTSKSGYPQIYMTLHWKLKYANKYFQKKYRPFISIAYLWRNVIWKGITLLHFRKRRSIDRTLALSMNFLVFHPYKYFFSLRLSASVPWEEHISTLIYWFSVSHVVTHCQLFSLEQAAGAVLYISTPLCCETSFSPSCAPFLFPSSSESMSYLGAFQTVRHVCLRAVLARTLMAAPDSQGSCCSWWWEPREPGQVFSSWTDLLGFLQCVWQQPCHITAEKRMFNLSPFSLG